MVSSLENLVRIMNTPELITKNSRSEGAKRMWERRKGKGRINMENGIASSPIKAWVYHTEWAALMTTLVLLFLWVYNEAKHTNDRLDQHFQLASQMNFEINKRVDESNKRSDDLHKEFYELLKETRK